MEPVEPGACIEVSVVYAPRTGQIDEVALQLGAGSTVADALRESGLQERHPDLAWAIVPIGVWGAPCERGDVLRNRDRVEVYRPLVVDPKEARRLRYQGQRKQGAKAGKAGKVKSGGQR